MFHSVDKVKILKGCKELKVLLLVVLIAITTLPMLSQSFFESQYNYVGDILLDEVKKNSNSQMPYQKRVKLDAFDTSGFDYQLLPYLNYNRIEELSGGINLEFSYKNTINLFAKGYYSTGKKRSYGEVGSKASIFNTKEMSLSLGAKVFSDIVSQSNDKTFGKFENTLTSVLFTSDYYDYVQKDGYEIFSTFKLGNFKLDAFYTVRRNFALNKTTDTLFELLDNWARWGNQKMPPQKSRLWDLLRGNFTYNAKNIANIDGLNANFGTVLSYGHIDDGTYNSYDCNARFKYNLYKGEKLNSYLDLLTEFGWITENAPNPQSFRMKARNVLFAPFGNFISAPIGIYGGNEYNTVHLRWNSSDKIFGAGLGGLELIMQYSAASYRTRKTFLLGMGSEVYQEFTFGLGRIPSLFSKDVDLEILFSKGFGYLAKDNYGLTLSLN